MNDLHALTCPMGGCDEPLTLTWTLDRPLYLVDIEDATTADALPTPDQAYTGTWRVECLSGHVLLLPATGGCPCPVGEQDGPSCPHDPDDYEWDEAGPHEFRRPDMDRLVALMDVIESAHKPAA